MQGAVKPFLQPAASNMHTAWHDLSHWPTWMMNLSYAHSVVQTLFVCYLLDFGGVRSWRQERLIYHILFHKVTLHRR